MTKLTHYKGTHKESGSSYYGETNVSMGQEIWALITGKEENDFLEKLRIDPSSVQWEVITEDQFNKLTGVIKPKKKSSRATPVTVISDFSVHEFESISKAAKFLQGKVSKAKVTAMSKDPTLSYEGYRIEKRG